MDIDRAAVKAQLIRTRAVSYAWDGAYRFGTLCPMCAKPDPTDLHELIITRKEAMGNPVLEAAILVAEVNLQLLCHTCHLYHAAERRDYLLYKQAFILGTKTEHNLGFEAMIAWLETLTTEPVNAHRETIKPFIQRVRFVQNDTRPFHGGKQCQQPTLV